MISFCVRRQVWLGFVAPLLIISASCLAQSKSLCTRFFQPESKIHTKVECVEALFSEPSWHLTFSSLPPGNGFALGGVYEQKTHYVTPFYPAPLKIAHPDPNLRRYDVPPPVGRVSSTDIKLAIIGSVNQSWVATGSFTLIPPLYTPDRNAGGETCQRLSFLCTRSQLALKFEGTHRSLQTISFYGLGPQSVAVKHTFHQNDTYGIVTVRLPLTNQIAAEGGVEVLQVDLPATSDPLSVRNNFTNATAPGLLSQPMFAHSHVGVSVAPVLLSNPVTDDNPLNRTGPLMKRNLRFTLNNAAEYHWYATASSTQDSFQQFLFRGDESIQLGSNVRRGVTVGDVGKGVTRKLFYKILQTACGDGHEKLTSSSSYVLKVTQQCDYGTVDLRSQLTTSSSGAGATLPFYLEPTVGGSDINSRVSLRGFPNYRFRDRNAVFVQADYTVPIYDPVELLLFYDAGTVGPTFSSLSFAHLRQDAGVGATFRLQGNVVAQTYVAWGAGHGAVLNYNFSKLF